MNTILAPLRELGEYEDIQKQLNTQQGKVSISGCVDSQKLHMVYGLTEKYDVKLIVTYSDMKAKELLDDCKLYCRESYYFPAKDLIFYQADIHSNQLIKERVAVLRKLLEGEPIEEVTPDEWDLKMLHDAASNPDCNEFVSSDTAMKELGL